MKIESLLFRLEQIRIYADNEADELDGSIGYDILLVLLEYINNEKVTEKVDSIPF